MSPTANRHDCCQAIICGALRTQGERQGLGIAYSTVAYQAGDPERIVCVDAGFAGTSSLPMPESPAGRLERAPDVVIEIRNNNDQPYDDRKVADHFSAGARAVVLIDLQTETVIIYRRDAAPQTLRQQDTLALDDNIPGFRLPVADLFAERG